PAETPGIITPFMVMYALHDAMVKPMPGEPLAPSLAESWSLSDDGLTYEFVLRKGAKFHNGDAVTAEDVKFSFERYRGTSYSVLKDRMAAVETPDPQRVRFKLKQPWSDFLTFYASATGAGTTINQALTLGYSKLTGSIIPDSFEYYWQPPAPMYDPAKAKQLLAEAGHPNGFDAGEYFCDTSYANLAEAVLNNLQAVGIQTKLRPLERAAFFKGYAEK